MLTIINPLNSPFYNLALEEYVFKNLITNQGFVLLWINSPSVIIGRNQNTREEINSEYIDNHKINVVRRITGGGAVYHDYGNLNFSFITKNTSDSVNNFRNFTDPVIRVLNKLGVKAEFTGRNDITVCDKKISGNAECYHKDNVLHHGTLLFDANLTMINNVLNANADKLSEKGIKSVRSRVTNILPHLKEKMSIRTFSAILIRSLLDTDNIASCTYTLSEKDKIEIKKLKMEKYLNPRWNYGDKISYNFQKSKRFAGGTIDIRLFIENNIIKTCKIYGDFFSQYEVTELEGLLVNQKFSENNITQILKNAPYNYFFNISADDFLVCLFT